MLQRFAVIGRLVRSTVDIRITSLGERHPITPHHLSEFLIFVGVLPVAGKRVTQEKQLFAVMRVQPSPLS
jgi:hypothetical protein